MHIEIGIGQGKYALAKDNQGECFLTRRSLPQFLFQQYRSRKMKVADEEGIRAPLYFRLGCGALHVLLFVLHADRHCPGSPIPSCKFGLPSAGPLPADHGDTALPLLIRWSIPCATGMRLDPMNCGQEKLFPVFVGPERNGLRLECVFQLRETAVRGRMDLSYDRSTRTLSLSKHDLAWATVIHQRCTVSDY